MGDEGAATIREVHDLLDKTRDEIVSAVRQDQRLQMDFNMNIASRLEAMASRLSAHETMPSHPTFQSEMNSAMAGVRDGMHELRSEMKDIREDFKGAQRQITDLRISYAKAAGIALVVSIIISILIAVLPHYLPVL